MKKLYSFSNIIFLCLLFTAASVKAQVYYQDIVPDKVMSTWDSKDIKIDSPATSNLSYGAAGNITIWNEFGTVINANAFSNCQVIMDSIYPVALNAGDTIKSTANWVQPGYHTLKDGTSGLWNGVTDKYLPVRIKRAGQWIYGWIRMDVNATGTSVTIKDYGCNLDPSAIVIAGQITSSVSEQASTISIHCYPNPASDILMIELPSGYNDPKVSVYNIAGQQLFTQKLKEDNTISISSLTAGTYFITISGNGIIYKGSFTKVTDQ